MAKRKRQEGRRPSHKEKPRRAESTGDVVSDEIATSMAITPTCSSRAIFVLEQASLHIGMVGKKRKILYAAEDSNSLSKKGKDPKDYRPDIFYEALREILDSPLNKRGRIGAVYVKTDSGVLFEVNPHARIPRTLKRFLGIILELLDKSHIRAKDSGEVLFRVLKGPLTQHLPDDARIIGLSYSSPKLVDIEDYLSATNDDLSLVFVVGTMVQGRVNKDGMVDYISVSNYPLGARCCVGMICHALEQKWDLLYSNGL